MQRWQKSRRRFVQFSKVRISRMSIPSCKINSRELETSFSPRLQHFYSRDNQATCATVIQFEETINLIFHLPPSHPLDAVWYIRIHLFRDISYAIYILIRNISSLQQQQTKRAPMPPSKMELRWQRQRVRRPCLHFNLKTGELSMRLHKASWQNYVLN